VQEDGDQGALNGRNVQGLWIYQNPPGAAARVNSAARLNRDLAPWGESGPQGSARGNSDDQPGELAEVEDLA
jgi:hypothetical protein